MSTLRALPSPHPRPPRKRSADTRPKVMLSGLLGFLAGAILVGAIGVAYAVHRERDKTKGDPGQAARYRAPAQSFHTVDIPPPPRPLCFICAFKIRVEREGDQCVMVAEQDRPLKYAHLSCFGVRKRG